MSGYEDLSIGALNRAAIDAYMKKQGFEVMADHYLSVIVVVSESYATSTMTIVEAPDADGVGGGDVKITVNGWPMPSGSSSYVSRFNGVRAELSCALCAFDQLPDPARFQYLIAGLEPVIAAVSTSMSDAPGGGSIFDSNYTVIQQNLSQMEGILKGAFEQYLAALPTVVANFNDVLISLYTAAKGTQYLLEMARRDTARIVESATAAFRKFARQPNDLTEEWTLAFDVIGAILDVIGLIPEAKGATVIGKAGIKLWEDVRNYTLKDVEMNKPGDYEAIHTAFADSFSQLRTEIRSEEEGLAAAMKHNLTQIKNNYSGGFDLKNPVRNVDEGTDLGSSDQVRVTEAVLEEVEESMKNIFYLLAEARDKLANQSSSYPWSGRPFTYGIAMQGAYPEFNDLLWALYAHLDDLASEVVDAKLRFAWGVRALLEYDDQAAGRLAEYAARIGDRDKYPDLL
ncbi:MAG: hypothetical protein LBR58_01345 [Propionibacteriaceae bacterium]|jgi:hypothetical protein|nr:hypothetical protein [Propionibacteriaceae bacterium]